MENKFTNIKDRVVEIAEKQNISKEKFFKSIGMTSASFRGNAKKTPLNSNAIVNIITKYPDTDLYWLLTGSTKESLFKENSGTKEPGIEYKKDLEARSEKDQIIDILQEQIKDLKLDKEDLRILLGLREEKKSK